MENVHGLSWLFKTVEKDGKTVKDPGGYVLRLFDKREAISIKEFAEAFGRTPNAVYIASCRGLIPTKKLPGLGRVVLILELAAWLRTKRSQ